MKRILIGILSLVVLFSAILLFSAAARYEVVKRINMISGGSYAHSEAYELRFNSHK